MAQLLGALALGALFPYAAANAAEATAVVQPTEAQEASQADNTSPANKPVSGKLEEVRVTGTLIRGVDPTGQQVMSYDAANIDMTGAATTTEFLRTVPQMDSFSTLDGAIPFGNRITTNRPNLRGLPGASTSGGSTTLLLFNGHRVAGMGIVSTTPDPDIVPPGALERVEIVPDGGSALYGSDAVAGVLNFITRKNFEGAEVEARYGAGDDFDKYDVSVTAGKAWGDGSAFVSFNHSEHDQVVGGDRDYIYTPVVASGFEPPAASAIQALECDPGNVLVAGATGTQVYALPYTNGNAVTGSTNQCDLSDFGIMYPEESRDSLMVGLNQELSDRVSLDVQAFYMMRDTDFYGGGGEPTTSSVDASNPFFDEHRVGAETGQTVSSQVPKEWGPFGQSIELDAYGITPTLFYDLNENWQLQLLGSYSESETTSQSRILNEPARNAATTISDPMFAYNPYDPGATNPQTLEVITNWGSFGKSEQVLWNTRGVIDGELFSLPGGSVKLAAGVEYYEEEYKSQQGDTVRGAENSGYAAVMLGGVEVLAAGDPLAKVDLDRDVSSVFGELVIPLVGEDFRLPGVEELTLSVSGRFDDYSDVGSTTNPKVGLVYKPVQSLSFRAAWGTSFTAPSLSDSADAAPFSAFFVPPIQFIPFLGPPDDFVEAGLVPEPNPLQTVLILQGNDPDIKPQKAESLTFGFDFLSESVPGLSVSGTYFEIEYEGQIDIPPITVPNLMYGPYSNLVTLLPTAEQIAATGALTQSGEVEGIECFFPRETFENGQCTYSIIGFLKSNLGDFRLRGIDFSTDYVGEATWGSYDLRVGGTYELDRDARTGSSEPWINQFSEAQHSRLRVVASVGANVGKLRSELIYRHRAGYDLPRPVGIEGQQGNVDDFDIFDLYFRYDVGGQGLLEDLYITLNVDNIFDEDPPEFREVAEGGNLGNSGISNGNTLGRVFQIGFNKRF